MENRTTMNDLRVAPFGRTPPNVGLAQPRKAYVMSKAWPVSLFGPKVSPKNMQNCFVLTYSN